MPGAGADGGGIVLAIEAAGGGGAVGVFAAGEMVAIGESPAGATGAAASVLPALVGDVLARSGLRAEALAAVAVCVGPGSFTGLRASVALAHGLALAAGRLLVPVTAAEALSEQVPDRGPRALLAAIDSRRPGRVFLACDGGPFVAASLADLPDVPGPVAVAGDAAVPVAAALAARGADVMLTAARRLSLRGIALAALHRLSGALPRLAPLPLYVDAPEARLPPAPPIRPPDHATAANVTS